MFRSRKPTKATAADATDATDDTLSHRHCPDFEYPLDWPREQRWNPRYSVPRNSSEVLDAPCVGESPDLPASSSNHDPAVGNTPQNRAVPSQRSFGRSRRDLDTRFVPHRPYQATNPGELKSIPPNEASRNDESNADEELSNLSHWLETLAELYMNELDNRARWDPRWLNVTRRERFEGLSSVTFTVLDYMSDDSTRYTKHNITTKDELATVLQTRPAGSEIRLLLVSDLSRFVMGALGQLYDIDPDFWFEHLANSGYGASDSGLKIKNAVWLNWMEREAHFRHRPLPGPGQASAWTARWRSQRRDHSHIRWGRLGLLNYLGRKGFFQDEIELRLHDGRWLVERDVVLNERGLLMTKKRQLRADKLRKKREIKLGKDAAACAQFRESKRAKMSNIYRPYSTFEGLPRNPHYWTNRDLRVLAPEGLSFWSGLDQDSSKIVIVLTDPPRTMQHQATKEKTPSITFMPRPMELESYTDEEWWRTADPDEDYLDPPPALKSRKQMRQERKSSTTNRPVGGINRDTPSRRKVTATLREDEYLRDPEHDAVDKQPIVAKVEGGARPNDDDDNKNNNNVPESVGISSSSDSEYDTEYEEGLRKAYQNRQPWMRDRDYARKYARTSHDLLCQYMLRINTSQLQRDSTAVPALLMKLMLDDMLELLSEIRTQLDHVDVDLADGDMESRILEAAGRSTRLNLYWLRSTAIELEEWINHAKTSFKELPVEMETGLLDISDSILSLKLRIESTISLYSASASLAQSALVIDQTSGINKLTELAFFFVPMSFITSIFSMQVLELTSRPPKIWTWGVALCAVVLITYSIRTAIRSPSMRMMALHCKATMLSRFTSGKPGDSARRFNTVGTRTVLKFVFFATSLLALVFFVLIATFLIFLFFGFGLWIGGAGVALYFIITRWPDATVLGTCFASLIVAACGLWVSCLWIDEMFKGFEQVTLWWAERVKLLFPEKWLLDSVDDDDLAQEGVNTYARQALLLAT